MSSLPSILTAASHPIEAISKVLDKLFTTEEERANAQAIIEKLRQHPDELQVELNKLETVQHSLFIAGWRPFIGYVCGAGLAMAFIINPIIQWITAKPGPVVPMGAMFDLVLALLGLGTLRTVEKLRG